MKLARFAHIDPTAVCDYRYAKKCALYESCMPGLALVDLRSIVFHYMNKIRYVNLFNFLATSSISSK